MRNFSIIQNNELSVYTISFSTRSEDIIKSIIHTNQLPDASVTNDYKSIIFKASSVKSFDTYCAKNFETRGVSKIRYNEMLSMIRGLSKQLYYLIHIRQKCFLLYTLENLLVIDDVKFVYVSNDHLLTIDPSSETLLLTFPLPKTVGFLSPEILSANIIPCKINYKTIYYSLGLLVLYGLTGLNETDSVDAIIKELNGLGSKIFGFVKRCLDKDLNSRCLLFI
jgi:hypothetical protein